MRRHQTPLPEWGVWLARLNLRMSRLCTLWGMDGCGLGGTLKWCHYWMQGINDCCCRGRYGSLLLFAVAFLGISTVDPYCFPESYFLFTSIHCDCFPESYFLFKSFADHHHHHHHDLFIDLCKSQVEVQKWDWLIRFLMTSCAWSVLTTSTTANWRKGLAKVNVDR
jgi:hypothetical protein